MGALLDERPCGGVGTVAQLFGGAQDRLASGFADSWLAAQDQGHERLGHACPLGDVEDRGVTSA